MIATSAANILSPAQTTPARSRQKPTPSPGFSTSSIAMYPEYHARGGPHAAGGPQDVKRAAPRAARVPSPGRSGGKDGRVFECVLRTVCGECVDGVLRMV